MDNTASPKSLMRAFLHGGATVIDVGANIGDLTVPLAKIVGPNGRVYAIESHPDIFNILCANLALNELSNTKPMNVFVATNDQVDTGGVWGKFAYVSQTWNPQFMQLDALELDACHLIKIDVDGKELEVLRSGEMQISDIARSSISRTTTDSSPQLLVPRTNSDTTSTGIRRRYSTSPII
jgi:FkbM family methyltransferase